MIVNNCIKGKTAKTNFSSNVDSIKLWRTFLFLSRGTNFNVQNYVLSQIDCYISSSLILIEVYSIFLKENFVIFSSTNTVTQLIESLFKTQFLLHVAICFRFQCHVTRVSKQTDSTICDIDHLIETWKKSSSALASESLRRNKLP